MVTILSGSELEREKRQARLNILPLLQVEQDREVIGKEAKLLQMEAEALRRGLKLSPELRHPYHDRKNYIPPTFS